MKIITRSQRSLKRIQTRAFSCTSMDTAARTSLRYKTRTSFTLRIWRKCSMKCISKASIRRYSWSWTHARQSQCSTKSLLQISSYFPLLETTSLQSQTKLMEPSIPFFLTNSHKSSGNSSSSRMASDKEVTSNLLISQDTSHMTKSNHTST